MVLLAAAVTSAIVSFVIARCYLIRTMKRLEKDYAESIDQMEKVSLNFMSQVKEQTEGGEKFGQQNEAKHNCSTSFCRKKNCK